MVKGKKDSYQESLKMQHDIMSEPMSPLVLWCHTCASASEMLSESVLHGEKQLCLCQRKVGEQGGVQAVETQ